MPKESRSRTHGRPEIIHRNAVAIITNSPARLSPMSCGLVKVTIYTSLPASIHAAAAVLISSARPLRIFAAHTGHAWIEPQRWTPRQYATPARVAISGPAPLFLRDLRQPQPWHLGSDDTRF